MNEAPRTISHIDPQVASAALALTSQLMQQAVEHYESRLRETVIQARASVDAGKAETAGLKRMYEEKMRDMSATSARLIECEAELKTERELHASTFRELEELRKPRLRDAGTDWKLQQAATLQSIDRALREFLRQILPVGMKAPAVTVEGPGGANDELKINVAFEKATVPAFERGVSLARLLANDIAMTFPHAPDAIENPMSRAWRATQQDARIRWIDIWERALMPRTLVLSTAGHPAVEDEQI